MPEACATCVRCIVRLHLVCAAVGFAGMHSFVDSELLLSALVAALTVTVPCEWGWCS